MSDEELLEIASSGDELSTEAEYALKAELTIRGIALPPPDRSDAEVVSDGFRDLVVIGRYVNLVEAQLAQSALVSAGIHAVLWDANMVRMDWGAIPAIGGIRLAVERGETEAARQILDTPSPNIVEQSGQSFENPACPKCGSTDTFLDYSDDPAIERWHCDSCSYEWTA